MQASVIYHGKLKGKLQSLEGNHATYKLRQQRLKLTTSDETSKH